MKQPNVLNFEELRTFYTESSIPTEEAKITCKKCGLEWYVECFYELGGHEPFNHNDMYCSECGTEAEIQ